MYAAAAAAADVAAVDVNVKLPIANVNLKVNKARAEKRPPLGSVVNCQYPALY